MNIDGAHNSYSYVSSCGGIVRDYKGQFVKGFLCNLSPYDALLAELHAFHLGLKVARDLALERVIFEIDSSVVVNIVARGSSTKLHIKSLLEEILSIICLPDWEVQVEHVFRKSNRCADFLGKSGFDAPPQLSLVDVINPLLSLYIENDCRGCYAPRLVL